MHTGNKTAFARAGRQQVGKGHLRGVCYALSGDSSQLHFKDLVGRKNERRRRAAEAGRQLARQVRWQHSGFWAASAAAGIAFMAILFKEGHGMQLVKCIARIWHCRAASCQQRLRELAFWTAALVQVAVDTAVAGALFYAWTLWGPS